MINKVEVVTKTKEFVKKKLKQEGSGHDWWHIYRVWKMAKHIGKKEKSDLFVIELAALLHDIADWKMYGGDEAIGSRTSKIWLEKLEVNKEIIEHICEIILTMSFKGAQVKIHPMRTIEGKIVQDADRLDAIGAIGIARTFTFGGHKGRPMWDPNIKPKLHNSSTEYLASSEIGNTINHFYEKLLLLKYRMNTKVAKQLAKNRHHFMEVFLKKFRLEWEGRV